MGRRRFGDRRDGRMIRDLDSMHYVMPLIYPNRCDNEGYMKMNVNIEKTEGYIRQWNKEHPENRISIFDVVITAMLKSIWLRPKMNRFITNNTMYQRNELTVAFTVKKEFKDDGEECLARVVAKNTDTLSDITRKIRDQVEFCKNGVDESTEAMNAFQKLPFKHVLGAAARFLDRHGWMPQSAIATDPYQCSLVVSNLGSIGMNAGYHHLMNWGTNSIFLVMGKKHRIPHYSPSGTVRLQKELELSLTIDERLADGYYYARTLKLAKKLIENPKLLELPLGKNVSY